MGSYPVDFFYVILVRRHAAENYFSVTIMAIEVGIMITTITNEVIFSPKLRIKTGMIDCTLILNST